MHTQERKTEYLLLQDQHLDYPPMPWLMVEKKIGQKTTQNVQPLSRSKLLLQIYQIVCLLLDGSLKKRVRHGQP